MDDNTRNILIKSITREVVDEMDRRNHALDGGVFLSSASTYGSAGVAPTDTYAGFIVLSTPTISSLTLLDTTKWKIAGNETIATFDEFFAQGIYYPIPFSTLTLTGGALILVKKR